MDYEQDFTDSKVDLKIWKRLIGYSFRNWKLLLILLVGQMVTALIRI